ncbi:MAG: glyoxalase/bleomycin resistance/extradiol dioxygenase family protein, partial [Pantoea sp.]|nr:glyoxalase/bleomycin resistance/extradiol dioxygenase family protein [Pantoea sp.]
ADASNILVSPARVTGDGYYEAIIRDPDGNLIEIVS